MNIRPFLRPHSDRPWAEPPGGGARLSNPLKTFQPATSWQNRHSRLNVGWKWLQKALESESTGPTAHAGVGSDDQSAFRGFWSPKRA
ncbi:unnamed protein product [Lota lota]